MGKISSLENNMNAASKTNEALTWVGLPTMEQYDEILEALKRFNNHYVKVTLKIDEVKG